MIKFIDIVKYLFIIIVGILVYITGDWGALKGQITEYPMSCESELINNNCPGSYFALNTSTYKPDIKRQEVVYWTNIDGKLGIERLTKCAVANRKNWTCKYDDESAEFGFENGHFHTLSLKSGQASEELEKKIFYVSRWAWLKNQVTNR